ncbi:cysteine hydrolase family protein [Prevotella sp. 10(H)]|uniref:cysteine hydrolase family protein n=1 Tax=Prevotella sp. 10(H) TaxID=1158294 RepID=UPI0004A71F53|nr:cysteine hydrolase family protein [Prevotella sp. 10(H)]
MKKALIIIDIQNDYFEGGRKTLVGADKASLNAKAVLHDCRKDNIPVIHVQHINDREGARFFLPGTTGIDIHENVKPIDGEKIIIKHWPNSFRETELLAYLNSLEIKELVICGMMTHMCIDTTVRAANDLGFINLLIGDACATLDLEIEGRKINAANVHYAFLAALNGSFAKVVTAEEYLNKTYLYS